MATEINIVVDTYYTWGTAPGDWDNLSALSSWDNYGVLDILCDADYALGFSETNSKTVSTPISETVTLSAGALANVIGVLISRDIDFSEMYSYNTGFIMNVVEGLTFLEDLYQTTSLSKTEAFSIASEVVTSSMLQDFLDEAVSFDELNERDTDFVRMFSEAVNFFELDDKMIDSLSHEDLEIIERFIRRGANAVIHDLYIREGLMTTEDLQKFAKGPPVGYEDYRPFVPGDYTFQQALVSMKVKAPITLGRAGIKGLTLNVDVPDVVDRGRVNVPSGGTAVEFTKTYHSTDDIEYQAFPVGGTTPVARIDITDVTLTGFNIECFDASNNSIAAVVSYQFTGR